MVIDCCIFIGLYILCLLLWKSRVFFSIIFYFLICAFRSNTLQADCIHKIPQPCFMFVFFSSDWFSALLYIHPSLTSGQCNHDNQCAVCGHISLIKSTAVEMALARVSWGLQRLLKCVSFRLLTQRDLIVLLLVSLLHLWFPLSGLQGMECKERVRISSIWPQPPGVFERNQREKPSIETSKLSSPSL